MRLTCPDCKAQYEVPSDVIPAAGRDVQCSNCGETWFQDHPESAQEETAAGISFAPTAQTPAAPAREAAEPATAPGSAASAPVEDAVPAAAPSEAARLPDPAPTPVAQEEEKPARRKLDPGVADVLREEAALEARARRNELVGSVESQPDLGLTIAPSAPRHSPQKDQPSPRHPEPRHDAPTPAKSKRPDRPAARDKNLPDIEEISSTLRSGDAPTADRADTSRSVDGRRSVRRGFSLMILVAIVLVLCYAFAPEIAELLPQADPWLTDYVAHVDTGRVWLDRQIQDLLAWLDAIVAAGE